MKKVSAIVLGLTMVLSMLAIIPASATTVTNDEFNHYARSTEAPLTVDENGDFSSSDAGWKLSEYKTTPEKDFVAEMDVYAIDGVVKDSINIRLRDADKFNTGAFDATTGYGVFVEATSGGNMYIYINKWVDSAWKGYLPLQGSTATNLTDSNIVQAAGADYTITFRISVQGDIVKAQAFLKGTDKRTAAATFDLSAPASGENAENNATIPAGGNIALATMRGKVGKLFGNFKCYNNGDFNGYGSDGNIGLVNNNGTLIGDGTSWKMSEYKTEPEANFTASVDCHTADGYLKDSINFRVKNSANFSSDGYDATIGLGAFVEANNDGTMYLYINKWSGGWKGYQPRVDIAETNLTDTEILAGAGTEYTVTLEATVNGNVVTVQAFLKGTDKKTEKVSFDLTAPATGETAENNANISAEGTVALTTMRWWAKGTVFSNFSIKNKSEHEQEKKGEYKFYATDGKPGMTLSEDGVFSSDGTSWKLVETPENYSDNFKASIECLPTASGIKDSICFRVQNPEKFAEGGYDLICGYGVFVETAGKGKPLYIYMDKWANGQWLGYLVPVGKLDANICDGEIMKGVGSDYSIIFDVTVEKNTVKAQASIKGTDKKTEVAVFDLTKKFNGENEYVTIPSSGKLCLGTMRLDVGEYFRNFTVTSLKQGENNLGIGDNVIPDTGDTRHNVIPVALFIMVISVMYLTYFSVRKIKSYKKER